MNNKGFAYTTIVYSLVLMLSLSMLIVFAVMSNSSSNNKEFVDEIDKELETCYKEGLC